MSPSRRTTSLVVKQGATRAVSRILRFVGATLSEANGEAVITISGGGGGGVPTTRTISTTAPLTGGGDLSADRTLAVSAATTTAQGVVELATDGETSAGVVVQGNDSRLSDSRTPTGAAGGDLGGTYPSPTVVQARGLRETGGPTTLTMGAVADGELLRRSGTTLVGAAIGVAIQAYNALLAAIAGLSSNGLIARTGSGSAAARTITAGSSAVTVSNGNGVAGNPTIDFVGGSNSDFDASKGRTFWLQPAGAALLAEGTTVSYGAGAPTDGSSTTQPIALFATSGVGTGKTFLSGTHARMGYGGTLAIRFAVTVVSADVRYFFALTSTATGPIPPPANCVGLVYDPGLSANWRMVGTNAGSTTYKDLGVAPVVGNIYRVEIATTLTTATLALYDLTTAALYSATIDTALGEFLPGSSTNLMAHGAIVSVTSAVVKGFQFMGARYRAQYT